ncbi:hypothetical protein [Candidatus Foliamicus sp.]
MQRIATLAALSLLLAGGSAWAGCDYPDEPTTPNAEDMTLEEFQAAIAEFREFQGALEGYRKCLEDDFNALDEEDRSEEREALFVKRYDSSVDREQQLAEQMNEQIRLWNEINKQDG